MKISRILFPWCSALLISCTNVVTEHVDYTKYVNTFIGTQGEGHCFPGATCPMGMVQLSPESYTEYYPLYENERVAGYQYNDSCLIGFSHTHLNGTGCPSLGDILFMPFCNRRINGIERTDFRSVYNKDTEKASPGYYSVYLEDHKVEVALTATPHVGVHKYHYENPENAQLLIDLQYGLRWSVDNIKNNVVEASQQFEDEYTLSGYRKAVEWTERKLYYVIRFSHPIIGKQELPAPGGDEEKAPRYLLSFDMNGDNNLRIDVGLSAVSVEGARKNLEQESMSYSFQEIKEKAKHSWNNILGRVSIKADSNKLNSFYTSLYHLYIQPNNIADVDGLFRAENDSVYKARNGAFYSTFSLWDTYRAAHPLYTILTPDVTGDILSSLMESFTYKSVDKNNPKESHRYLPRWGLWGKEVHTMIGNHAVTVLADAWLKGIRPAGFSDEELYEAIRTTQKYPHYRNHVELIDSYGYIPSDISLSSIDDRRETVSRLLEGTLNDYAVFRVAQDLDIKDDMDFFAKRADYYKNVFDPSTRMMISKNAAGEFRKNINPEIVVGEWVENSDYTEGNSWHYLFHVQHDVTGMIDLFGGRDSLKFKLDSMFYSKTHPWFTPTSYAYGCLGQYWHGNEPCHHIPYLYKYTNEGYKTDAIIRYLVDNFYINAPDGLKGNDDCGQMSAWYVFSCLGFYPVNPCGDGYVLGAPQVPYSEIRLPEGKKMCIVADNLSDENMFVEKIFLNGIELYDLKISHNELINGGEIRFVMTNRADVKDLQNFCIN